MQEGCNFDAQLLAAQALCLLHTDGVEHQPLFSTRADGKAHFLFLGRGAPSQRKVQGPWCATVVARTGDVCWSAASLNMVCTGCGV